MKTRLTKKRQAILRVLEESSEALSAAEVHALVPEVDLATVYRNLEHFTNEKTIKKLQLGTQEARFEFQHEPHHHAVCTECERVLHFTAPDEKIKKLLRLEDFKVDELEVTVRGICNHQK
ncbi:transcriptional repressor [Candidatus Kaiserbacteria bacterium]|nr:transcriptional repressor [Candidatus Kaiserbacteria bacterium]MCB9812474.1 transcriptional repressor [Candidatus Nomurabacteria bacterium]